MIDADGVRKTVANLLQRGARMAPGARLLIVHEPPGAGYYDDRLLAPVAAAAESLGYPTVCLERSFDPELTEPDAETAAAMEAADLTLFLARMGDQIRYRPGAGRRPIAICYALDLEMFASPFGQIGHDAMTALRDLMDRVLREAREISITCPAGTDLRGSIPPTEVPRDTKALRFPLSVYTPMPAAGLSGHIVQRGFAVGTGSRFYQPYAVGIEDILLVRVHGGRITALEGPSADAVRAHYLSLGARYGIDPWAFHSWHGGIHPACAFREPAAGSFERWSGGAFGNPRVMHFHTCGAYAPGEISLNIIDATMTADGVPLKTAGRLNVERLPGGPALLAAEPALARVLADPAQDCGLAPCGSLSFR